MKFLIDTANLEEIENIFEYLPIEGVTTNPSIVKNENRKDYFEHMRKIRDIIGRENELHVQVVAADYIGIMKDAEAILDRIDEEVFIKVPVTKEGLKAIKKLKSENIKVTATAVYTKFQAYLAIAAGADYIAPYYNRMENLDINPIESIRAISNIILETDSNTKILAASFKNINQVNSAFENGAHAATISADIFENSLKMPSINQAVDVFRNDWESIFGENKSISDL